MVDHTAEALAGVRPQVSREAWQAADAFLIRYRGATLALYRGSLVHFFQWAINNDLDPLLDIRRPHVEAFIVHLTDVRGNAPSTVGSRLAAITGYFRYAELDELIRRSPAEYVRRPMIRRGESIRPFLNSLDLMLIIRTADNSPRDTDPALVRLMGTMGLRVTEVCTARIEDMKTVRGHRTITYTRKGGQVTTDPIPVQTIPAVERAIGDRTEGTILIRPDWGRTTAGLPFTRRAVADTVARLCKKADVPVITPHGLRTSYITAGLDFGLGVREMQAAAHHADPRTTMGYDRHRLSLDRHASHVIAAKLAS